MHLACEVRARSSHQRSPILLISNSYAPETFGVAPYASQLAEHLVREGEAVEAFVGFPHYPHWRLSRRDRFSLCRHEVLGGVKVTRLRQFIPRAQDAVRRGAYEVTFFLHCLVRMPWRVRPEGVVAVVPGLGGGVAAALLARVQKKRLTLFVQDLCGAGARQSGMAGGRAVSRVVGALEGWVLRQAASVVVLNDAFRVQALKMGVPEEKCWIIPNWSHEPRPMGDRSSTREAFGWREDEYVVLHAGNMGLKQDLGNVVAAAALAEERGLPIRFVLMGGGNQRATLGAIARNCDLLTFEEPLVGQSYMDALGAADVLLVNERATVVDMSLPSKLASYFLAGRPVLAAVAANGTTATQVRTAGAGIVIQPGRPSILVDAVNALRLDVRHAEVFGMRALEYAERVLDKDRALSQLFSLILPLGGLSPTL